MLQRHGRSTNSTLFRSLRNRLRMAGNSKEVSYLLIFTFLYKYSSDSLKQYLLGTIEDKEITFDELYGNPDYVDAVRRDAHQMLGFFINNPNAFIDEVISTKLQDDFFINEFYSLFVDNVDFDSDSNYEKYFNFIFDNVKRESNLFELQSDSEYSLLIKDMVHTISKLDINESKMPCVEVFDLLCKSILRIDYDSDFINELLTGIVSQANHSGNVYNPFLNDGSSLIKLNNKDENAYYTLFGKCSDKLTYCCSLVKFFMSFCDLDEIFVEYGNAMEYSDVDGISFDAIISKLPPVGGWRSRYINQSQNLEFSKKSKRRQIEDILSNKLGVDENSFLENSELNFALENLVDKLDIGNDLVVEFRGEYESLIDSEYLFLLNLINTLKNNGIMAVVVSQSFLFKNSLETLRKYLTYENNYIDAIINIPEVYGRSSRPEIICIFRKNRGNDDILFIDLSKNFKTKKSPNLTRGVINRNLILDDESLKKLLDVCKNRKVIDKYSNLISISEIEDNDFNLSVSRYVDTFEGEFIQLSQLVHEKEEIDYNIEKLNKKIHKMMDDLNIDF
ncbi:N-6 DNA methylase [Methanobrevibacter sp.]|uniref:N-6 DNA methylase n=1 Tax=Methanobrevibacter sp. TaxID=66852 RepID=UPI0026DF7165|nr:N-6 DNA methylase [Methanobrevibacter sp.]MDO5824375.1 N-6 DNA methylase [Methanobrevibacter sp.]